MILDPYSWRFTKFPEISRQVSDRLINRFWDSLHQQAISDYLRLTFTSIDKEILDVWSWNGLVYHVGNKLGCISENITFLDASEYLLKDARGLIWSKATTVPKFVVWDAQSMDFQENQFDTSIAHTLMNHVESPLVVISEMIRVTKSGGYIVFFDMDVSHIEADYFIGGFGSVVIWNIEGIILKNILTYEKCHHDNYFWNAIQSTMGLVSHFVENSEERVFDILKWVEGLPIIFKTYIYQKL